MPLIEHDVQLSSAVNKGALEATKAALQAGANVNGSPGEPYPPIVAATIANHAGIVNVLLEQGADPDRPVAVKVSFPSSTVVSTLPGERALHIAARSGKVEIVRLLLNHSRTDPNATDSTGLSPLLATSKSSHACVEVGRLLLEAGADPVLATNEEGFIPLHVAVIRDNIDLVDMLCSRAPATLNHPDARGRTPLFLACHGGHESIVSKLLSLGPMQPKLLNDNYMCPLAVAVSKGFVGVVRILMSEGGMRAVGDEVVLYPALGLAARFGEARILRLLLAVHGEGKRSEWANIRLDDSHLLHYASGCCRPTAAGVLLEAGADETARDWQGRIPLDFIGMDPDGRDGAPLDRGEEVAIRRMLQRGPAYRARSWGWPLDAKETGVGGNGDGSTITSAAAAAASVLSSPPAVKTPSVVDLRIFRPKEKITRTFFVRLIGRYCAKD